MSATDAPKPVEETPAAAPAAETVAAETAPATTEETPATEAPAAEAAATTEATEAAPAAAETTEAAAETEAPKEEAKEEEVTPATDGTLGYKGPGLVRSFRFTKRFFYFSDEAVEAKQLTSYLASEKSSAAAQRTAAWATQTGKGLLFLTKRPEDKATPAGIFNLSEVTDISKEGSNEFTFKTNGQKHAFQASTAAERDSWFAALTAKSTEAQAEKETVTGSEGYKAELEKITKPAGIASAAKAAAGTATGAATGAAATATTAVKDAEAAVEGKKEEKKEDKKEDKKSRSQSRKRASIFGNILGKKEVKEETPATTEAEPAQEAAAATEAAAPAEESTAAASEEAAPAAAETPAETSTETPAEEKKEPKTSAKAKRASIFGSFFNKVASPSKEKTEEEVVPVASSAPQLDNPVDENAAKPIQPETVTEAPAAAEGAAVASSSTETPAAAEAADKKEETTPEAKDKRRTSLFGTLSKKVEGEAKKTNKLGGLFRKPSKAVKPEEDKKEATPAEPIAEAEDKPEPLAKDAPAEEATPAVADKPEEPAAAAAAEPVNVAPAAAPVQAAA